MIDPTCTVNKLSAKRNPKESNDLAQPLTIYDFKRCWFICNGGV